jgi:hypothetical protein
VAAGGTEMTCEVGCGLVPIAIHVLPPISHQAGESVCVEVDGQAAGEGIGAQNDRVKVGTNPATPRQPSVMANQ